MATQTINYLPPVRPNDETIADHSTTDKVSQLIRQSLIGPSRWTEKARRLVAAHAAHDNSVVLDGEPGTGKHFLARLIHQCSRYSEGPFACVSLGSTTEDVARSVLFGRTRSQSDELPSAEKGLIELAAGGTLYIDGLLETSTGLAGDIAQFMEDSWLNRKAADSVRILFGSTQPSSCQWRTSIGSKSKDISCERIQIPPLRERRDDIEALAAHFVTQNCEQSGKELRAISENAVSALRNYDWPRNVSELKSVVNHLVRQSGPPSLDLALLPVYIQSSGEPNQPAVCELDLDNEVRQFEINLICAALRQSRGLQNKAARLLRLRPTTLFMKIKRYNIDVSDFR